MTKIAPFEKTGNDIRRHNLVCHTVSLGIVRVRKRNNPRRQKCLVRVYKRCQEHFAGPRSTSKRSCCSGFNAVGSYRILHSHFSVAVDGKKEDTSMSANPKPAALGSVLWYRIYSIHFPGARLRRQRPTPKWGVFFYHERVYTNRSKFFEMCRGYPPDIRRSMRRLANKSCQVYDLLTSNWVWERVDHCTGLLIFASWLSYSDCK